MAGNSKISNLDPAAALTGTEELPVVQVGDTVKTTTQAIADLVPASSNLGGTDLTSISNERIFKLNGSISTNKLTFKNAATNDIIQFRGDSSVYIPTGRVGHGMTPNAIIQYRLGGAHGLAYGLYVDGTYSVAGVRVLSTSATNKFTCSNIGDNQIGYNSESNTAATADRIAHRASINGTNTAANIGFTCDVTNGANNYALNILNGSIRVPSGGIGQSETVTFGGGSTGDIASMTFEEGIYISKTLVP